MYKVFVNDRVIVLTDKFEDYDSSYDTLFINYNGGQSLQEAIEVVSTSDVVFKLCVHAENLDQLWSDFNSLYENIEAAGGIVRKDNKVLVIHKKGHWDLPKGKIDGSESLEEAAKREVTEECGLNNLQVFDQINPTYHIYQEGEKVMLKKTDWFLMGSESDGPLKGDAKEGITDVRWVSAEDWKEMSKSSFASVNEILADLF